MIEVIAIVAFGATWTWTLILAVRMEKVIKRLQARLDSEWAELHREP